MVEDSLSDVEFGRNLGVTTIFIEGDAKPGNTGNPGRKAPLNGRTCGLTDSSMRSTTCWESLRIGLQHSFPI
jgi:hypothetical protein